MSKTPVESPQTKMCEYCGLVSVRKKGKFCKDCQKLSRDPTLEEIAARALEIRNGWDFTNMTGKNKTAPSPYQPKVYKSPR